MIIHNGQEITDLESALKLLKSKATKYGRKIDFEPYRKDVAEIMAQSKVYDLWDEKGILSIHALSYIILEINRIRGIEPGHFYHDRSLDELLILAGDEVDIEKVNEFTYTYRNGGTTKLEAALRGSQFEALEKEEGISPAIIRNRILKSSDEKSSLRILQLENTPVTLMERAYNSPDVIPQMAKKLQDVAKYLVENTDILSSLAWRSARTLGEYIGTVGEYLAQIDIENVMPLPERAPSSRQLRLANVHFYGDIYDKEVNGHIIRTNTDTGSELDLLIILEMPTGWEYVAVGNVKVGKTNLAREARKQNNEAYALLQSFNEQTKVLVDAKKAHWALVKLITALDIKTRQIIRLNRPLIPAKKVNLCTIAAQGASGNFTHYLKYSFQDIKVITTYIQYLGGLQ